MRNLLKEIITTETEKFTEDGIVKERIKETREKIYTKQEIDEEAVEIETKEVAVEPPKETIEISEEVEKKDLITEAANAIDSKNSATEAAPVPTPPTMPQMGNYKVVDRTTPTHMGSVVNAAPAPYQKPTFPWENK